jgi:thiamine biosynthesis lipoprotein
VARALADVDQRLSTWRDDSEISRLNASHSTAFFDLSPETVDVLEVAARTSAASGGAFDVTVLPLVEAWGFGRAPEVAWPTDAEVQALRADVGWRLLELRREPPGARKARPGLRVDCSALGKGYALDRVVSALESAGARDFLVELGGELAARGRHASGAPWVAGVERPEADAQDLAATVRLEDAALATSGDYRRVVVHEGRRLSHLIDPRTGWPVADDLASATVVHREAVVADAWATALMVLGPEAAWDAARAQGLAALLLAREGGGLSARATPAFEALRLPPDARASERATRETVPGGGDALGFVVAFVLFALAAGALALRLRRPPGAACRHATSACRVTPCRASSGRLEEPSDVRVPPTPQGP